MRGTKIVLQFGIVTIPCKRGPVAKSERVAARRLCPDHMQPISLKSWCEHDHEVEETVSGYDDGNGGWVVVDREALVVEKDGILALTAFVEEFDPAFYEKTEVLGADTGGERSFSILAQALRERGGMAVGECVINKARRMVGVRWSEALDCIVVHHLALARDVRWESAQECSPTDAKDGEVAVAVQLLESLEASADLADARDEYDERIRAQVAAAKKPVTAAKKKPDEMVDLMAALKASVAANKKETVKS